jgi:hypothetical protein
MANPLINVKLPSWMTSSPGVQQSTIANPGVAAKPITPNNIKQTSTTNATTAPVVSPNVSDLQAQNAALLKQYEDRIKELESAKTAEPPQPAQPSAVESALTSLEERQQAVQDQVASSRQALLDQQNAIYAKWGITPESFEQIRGLTTQIADYQKQMADLDTREAQAVDNAQNRAGTDLAFASGETARIQRAYAIQKSGIAANASILSAQAEALQGNFENATKAAEIFVDNATKAQQQVVSDLKWGFEQYSDIIQSMTSEETQRINDEMDFQSSVLKQQQDDYWNQVNADLKARGLDIEAYKASQSGAGSPAVVANMDYYIDQVKNRTLDLTTPTLPQDTRQSIINAMAQQGISIPKPLTAKQKNAADDATSGLDAVQQLRDMANKGELPLYRTQILGEGFLGRLSGNSQFVNLKKEAADIKTRIRTGAALNDSEIQFYSTQVPSAGDSGEDIQEKLDQLEGFYLGMSGLPVTVEDTEGNQFTFEDLYNPQQRLGLKQSIAAGYKLSY